MLKTNDGKLDVNVGDIIDVRMRHYFFKVLFVDSVSEIVVVMDYSGEVDEGRPLTVQWRDVMAVYRKV